MFKGKKASNDKIIHAWDRSIVRDGVSYRINREHPLLSALNQEIPLQTRNLLHDTFDLLEQMIPLDAIYLDLASQIRPAVTTDDGAIRISTLEVLATQIVASIGRDTDAGQRFLDMLASIEPFSFHPEIAKEIAARLKCVTPM
jgi:hypothetical protein